jgi:prepilin-type processing-associated H-X9-DG protein
MTVDLTGGLPLSREDVFVAPPENPAVRESVNIWLHDNQGRFSLPRVSVEAVSNDWARPGVQANMAFADGRVLIGSCVGDAHSPYDDAGRPTVLGSGPLSFRCVEPFRRWTMTFVGDALDTTIADQVAGRVPDGPRVDVEVHVDMTMAVPPWIQGEMGERARALLEGGKDGLFMGGDRYEQLFTATGTFRAGDDTLDFSGSGLRIHRQGIRDTTEFAGHCWQSAVFPSGKAFGYIAFADTGVDEAYREGFVYADGRMLPATLVEAPWMTKFEPHGGAVPLVLESELGMHRIGAVTTCSTAMPGLPMAPGSTRPTLFFHQGSARYEWDGEEAHGMIERSLPADQVAV